MLLAVDESVLF